MGRSAARNVSPESRPNRAASQPAITGEPFIGRKLCPLWIISPEKRRWNQKWVMPGLSLAYIGTAASKKLGDELCAYPRRFRLGGKKEAAGVCCGCGEPMEFESQTADNERVITLLHKADDAILSGPWPQSMARRSVRGACGFVLAGYPDITRKLG